MLITVEFFLYYSSISTFSRKSHEVKVDSDLRRAQLNFLPEERERWLELEVSECGVPVSLTRSSTPAFIISEPLEPQLSLTSVPESSNIHQSHTRVAHSSLICRNNLGFLIIQ